MFACIFLLGVFVLFSMILDIYIIYEMLIRIFCLGNYKYKTGIDKIKKGIE